MARIDAFLKLLKDQKGSDLHFIAGSPPIIRVRGDLIKLNFRVLSAPEAKTFLYEILTPDQIIEFEKGGDYDGSYDLEGIARFRVNIFMQKNGMGAVFRIIPARIHSIEDLALPDTLKYFARLRDGLVLVTGPTGSGKSTTLAAIIDVINREMKKHILTIEDPIEFVHKPAQSYLSQREVERHTESFSSALRAASREGVDVILVGEMRDLETISLAMTCAVTGSLVFGTLHTNSASKTVDRIIDVFPADRQNQVTTMLSQSLRGVIAQQLLKTADGKGRVAALEILIGTPALSNLIREKKSFQIPSLIQSNRDLGMQTMDQSLIKLVEEGVISPKEAYYKANDRKKFEQFVEEIDRVMYQSE
jgi:twitching motility protein PilT